MQHDTIWAFPLTVPNSALLMGLIARIHEQLLDRTVCGVTFQPALELRELISWTQERKSPLTAMGQVKPTNSIQFSSAASG